ncbi:metallophosphoesterase [Micromonospora sp. HM5-17]|jgi:predicted MPP superfamily phosphohydrolase|uniref:metallophosphoesterase n=1 Tax=Micromonospora sp. HM5-17 TaxID=2487710 RepID=UPI000F49ACC9|nr:metallophosphoesterase [Micromonospora sp. HM5-17]ROT27998.1 metallophosphoesterase [Micromonospora sp. HM5-17]
MRKRTVFRLAAGAVVAGGATLAYASLIERNMFTLRRYDVPVLAADAEPLRILHLSDMHMMPDQRRKQNWVAALAGTDPDLVVVTGDNLAHPEAVPGALRALQPLLDLPGAFVFGSNDYRGPVWKNPFGYLLPEREYVQGVELPVEDLREVLVGAGWADLNNARTTIKAGGRTIELVGVDDPHVDRDDYGAVAGPVDTAVDLAIGVTHSPEPRVLDDMAADGFTLLLAGHTHGGQVRVPFVGALTTNCGLPRSMARGLHRWPGSDAWLHVSAGLGTHPTAPVRFACRPEASLLTLIPR